MSVTIADKILGMDPIEAAANIASWLKRQADAAWKSGFVVGMSGGVDSAVVLSLAAKAVGQENVLGVVLPCENVVADMEDAEDLCSSQGVEFVTYNLAAAYSCLCGMFGVVKDRVSRGNIKARLRMITLYHLAREKGYLVAGTGNASESWIGYFTKGGDGCVDLLPIGSLVKREVRALDKALGIPDKIIEKTPTAGLWTGQTDEGEMGMTYDELDDCVEAMERGDQTKLNARGDCGKLIDRVAKLHEETEHKRQAVLVYPGKRGG